MPFSRYLKIPLISTALLVGLVGLSGCATGDDFADPTWRPFKDIDGSIQEVSFYSWKQITTENGKSQERVIPKAYLANQNNIVEYKGKHLKTKQELGALQPLGQANEQANEQASTMATIFRVNGKALDIYDQATIKTLAESKNFDFYEFGQMRLSHAKFTAKKGICQDFNDKKGKNAVDLIMTSNYYPENSFTDFYTALINVKLNRHFSPKEIGYTPSFTGNDTRLQTELKSQEQKHGKNLVTANVKEKASILFNIICR